MNNFKKNIYRTIEEEIVSNLEQGNRSSINQAAPNNGCNLTVDTICYLETSVNGVVTNGDYIYNDINGLSPIIGNNQFYKVELLSAFYVVQVNDGGQMTDVTVCF